MRKEKNSIIYESGDEISVIDGSNSVNKTVPENWEIEITNSKDLKDERYYSKISISRNSFGSIDRFYADIEGNSKEELCIKKEKYLNLALFVINS